MHFGRLLRLAVLQSGEPRHWGRFVTAMSYTQGIYSVQVFPVVRYFLGIAFEDATERAQQNKRCAKVKSGCGC